MRTNLRHTDTSDAAVSLDLAFRHTIIRNMRGKWISFWVFSSRTRTQQAQLLLRSVMSRLSASIQREGNIPSNIVCF